MITWQPEEQSWTWKKPGLCLCFHRRWSIHKQFCVFYHAEIKLFSRQWEGAQLHEEGAATLWWHYPFCREPYCHPWANSGLKPYTNRLFCCSSAWHAVTAGRTAWSNREEKKPKQTTNKQKKIDFYKDFQWALCWIPWWGCSFKQPCTLAPHHTKGCGVVQLP